MIHERVAQMHVVAGGAAQQRNGAEPPVDGAEHNFLAGGHAVDQQQAERVGIVHGRAAALGETRHQFLGRQEAGADRAIANAIDARRGRAGGWAANRKTGNRTFLEAHGRDFAGRGAADEWHAYETFIQLGGQFFEVVGA